MDVWTIIGGVTAIIGCVMGIAAVLNGKVKSTTDTLKELHETKFSGVGRSLDEIKDRLHTVEMELQRHDRKISQSDIVMVHIDDTMKKLGNAVEKLDTTLNALQLSLAKKE
jgi:septal ring factor EnvC (AmiA/AmiB activator)